MEAVIDSGLWNEPRGAMQVTPTTSPTATRELLVRLVELGVTSCSVGERVKVWPEWRVPQPVLEELEVQRSILLDVVGLVGSAGTFDGDSVAEPLPEELRRWPPRQRYAVAVLERAGVPRADAVAAVRG